MNTKKHDRHHNPRPYSLSAQYNVIRSPREQLPFNCLSFGALLEKARSLASIHRHPALNLLGPNH